MKFQKRVGLTPRQRLARLREVIADTPAETIEMAKWRSVCGTTACIAGHGAMDPVLQAEGLNLLPLTGSLSIHGLFHNRPQELAKFFGINDPRMVTALFYDLIAPAGEETKARQLALMDQLLEERVEA